MGLGEGAMGDHGPTYYSPLEVVAARTGLKRDTIWHHSNGSRGRVFMAFDVADKILAAIDRLDLWRSDPDLEKVYGKACRGADRINPIAEPDEAYEADEPRETPEVWLQCEQCSAEFKVTYRSGSPRRFCSQNCRQAAYKARKLAA